MASPEKQDDKKKTSSRSKKQYSKPRKQGPKPGSSGSKLLETGISGSRKVGPKKQTTQNELHLTGIPQSKKADTVKGIAKVSNNSACKRKKAVPKLRSYSLRSLDRGRVLRSKLDTAKSKTTMNSASNPEKMVTRKKKSGKKKVINSGQDELSRILKHIRYMLKRMNYEQSLIDAYSCEGWKGQSAEKIRPEKELERAKSEILRCKLKIREIFQHLDSLLAEGKLQESLFDSDGIDSENIFCGMCSSKDVSADNDIILCDGVCERGFHQKCLNPPLLRGDIPTGDEGWLCPQCDCKVECIDLLSELRGIDLSFEDSWEIIFPEAAVLVNGNGKYDDLNLPSDDSEDDDYDPNAQRVDVDEKEEGSGDEESDSSSLSYDSTSSDDNMNQAAVELPTDDSEDDDYNPDASDPDIEIRKSKSSSDESDFTSDSDEFCTELKKISCVEEATASSLPSLDNRDEIKDKETLYDHSKVPSGKLEIDKHESCSKSSHKRDREKLDYKKLYDEAYGQSSSDSSEDEEWNEKSSPKKLKNTDDKPIEEVANDNSVKITPKLRKKNVSSSAAEKDHGPHEPHSSGYSYATVLKKNGVASKKLYEAFQESQYPTKEKKESLAQEHGMTYQQVSKWFGNARHSSRVSTKESNNFGKSTSDTIHCDIPTSHSNPDKGVVKKSPVSFTPYKAADKKKLDESFQENQYPSREKKEELAEELGVPLLKVSRWFETARRRSRASTKESSIPATSSPNKSEASCRTPSSHKLDIGEEEITTGALTPDKAIITTTTSTEYPLLITSTNMTNTFICNAKHDDRASPRYKVTSSKIPTSPCNPDHGIDLDSSIANGTASNEKGEKAADNRQKAIAKELRKMRAGR